MNIVISGFISLTERQRSPSAHFVRRRGGTPCSIHSLLLIYPVGRKIGGYAEAIRVVYGQREYVGPVRREFRMVFCQDLHLRIGSNVRKGAGVGSMFRIIGFHVSGKGPD